MNDEKKVIITSEEEEVIRSFLDERYHSDMSELTAQQLISELTHWIYEFGGDVQ
jgi:hypothetical protein